MLALTPITLKDRYFVSIEAEIRRILNELIYLPLMAIAGIPMREISREIKNARGDALIDAVANGTIWYEDGQFKGRFNARTSAAIIKLGGTYNVRSGTYSLPARRVPIQVKFAQTKAQDRYEKMRAKMLDTLYDIDPNMVDLMSKAKEEYEKTVSHLEADLQKTLPAKSPKKVSDPIAGGAENLVIEAKLTESQKKNIAAEWGNNLDLYIKGWTEKSILELRTKIQPHVLAGGRAEGLVQVIQDSYQVSARKAKFLARQETSLLMSSFKANRYQDIGISTYRWSDAHDRRVRHDHHALNGRVFRYDSPPITCTTGKNAGARNNPGQDFGCRCVDIPLI